MKKDGVQKSSLINKSFKLAYDKCIPVVVTLELTQKCNFKCFHCYNFDRRGEAPTETFANELESHEIIKTIDQVAELGCLYLNLSGGEVLLHPHLEDFIQRARHQNMEPRIKTNALNMTEDRLHTLMNAGLRSVDISFYGFSDKSYESFTGVPKSFERVKNAILLISKKGLELNVNIILHRENVFEFEQMVEFCEGNSINFQISTEVTDRYDESTGARDYEITPEQFEKLLLGKYGHFFMVKNSAKNVQCSCARSVCGINSVGDIFPCIGAPIKAGNIKEQALSEIWKNSEVMQKIRNLQKSDFEECMQCEFIEYCNRSSGTCYINTGNYTGCDTAYLEQAKIRFKHKDKF